MLMNKFMKNISIGLLVLAVFLSTSVNIFAQDVNIEVDQCANIGGTQIDIPGGYHRSFDNDCEPYNENGMPSIQVAQDVIIDVCPNLTGDQEIVPVGYYLVDNTNCLPDVCPNIKGAQAKIPNNYWIGDGECRINIDIGASTKDGLTLSTPRASGKYVYDACPNMWGIQGGVPAGYLKDTATNKCMKKPVVKIVVPPQVKKGDFCSNMEGAQDGLPAGYKRPEGTTTCFKI